MIPHRTAMARGVKSIRSSSVIPCRSEAGGFVGNGCVRDALSPGTVADGTGRSSIGHTGLPVTRLVLVQTDLSHACSHSIDPVVCFAAIAIAAPAFAHHGPGTFELSKTVSFTAAKLTKIELLNPHRLYFKTTEPDGK